MDEKDLKKGTTTVGIVCSDGLVLAADKRATMGNLIANKDVEKVLPITDRIFLTMAGAVGDAQMIVKYIRSEMKHYEITKQKKPSVKVCASLTSHILFSGRMSFIPYIVQFILAGKDRTGYHLFGLDMGGSVLEDKYTSTGSGSPVAFGVLEDNYKEGMLINEGVRLAVRSVSAAIRREAFTGEGVDVYTVTNAGLKKLPEEEVRKQLKA